MTERTPKASYHAEQAARRLSQARAARARGEGVSIAAGRCSYCPRRAYYHTPHGYLCEICAEGPHPVAS